LKSKKTKKGIYVDSINSMSVSKNGDFIWGVHLSESRRGKVLRQCFSSGDSLLYDYQHEDLADTILVVEDLKTVISGGCDQKAVLHDLDSGQTNKIIEFQSASLTCLFRVEDVLVIGNGGRVWFFDMVNAKDRDAPDIQLEGACVFMSIREGKSKGNNVELLVGNTSPKLNQITLKLD
jgi:hypothetical protein